MTREERAADARDQVRLHYGDRQRAFIDFVLAQYTKDGVGELDGDKLAPLLRLEVQGASLMPPPTLASPPQIRDMFIGFQRYLYEPVVGPAWSNRGNFRRVNPRAHAWLPGRSPA